jgi:hypothetical protein
VSSEFRVIRLCYVCDVSNTSMGWRRRPVRAGCVCLCVCVLPGAALEFRCTQHACLGGLRRDYTDKGGLRGDILEGESVTCI